MKQACDRDAISGKQARRIVAMATMVAIISSFVSTGRATASITSRTPVPAEIPVSHPKKGSGKIVDTHYEDLGPMLSDIGHAIIDQIGRNPKSAYLFSYCGENWSQVALYVDEGKFVNSLRPSDELFELTMSLWSADNANRPKRLRWIYFNYDIQDGKFKVHFVFPGEIAPGTDHYAWQSEGYKERFGDKPMIQTGYPPVDDSSGG